MAIFTVLSRPAFYGPSAAGLGFCVADLTDQSTMCEALFMRTQAETDNLDLSLLRTFLALIEHGSMGKTAVAVHKTQPAISHQILRLETIVGQKLLTRGRNGIQLTSSGQLLATYAARAVELNEEMLLKLRGKAASPGTVLETSANMALVGLASAMRRFQALGSGLELKVLVTVPGMPEASMSAAKFDWAGGDSGIQV
jgi:DNA-binding transcriptional LysR family regulator